MSALLRKALYVLHPRRFLPHVRFDLILVATLGQLLIGCSSGGSHIQTHGTSTAMGNAVYLEPVPLKIPQPAPQSISLLEPPGFIFVPKRGVDILRLRFLFTPDPWNMIVAVELLEGERPLVTGRAVNPGWGNMIARGASITNLA